MEFQIDIADKVAKVIGAPIIVCGNDDYKVRFTFDAEWLSKTAKTARFKWTERGENKHIDVPFTGSTVEVPVLSNITAVQIGVYADDLQTTTPARVPCVKSILCGSGTHASPTTDVYNQLIAMIEKAAVQTPVTLAVEDRNSGTSVSFWIGTQAEYESLTETVDNCLYILTDDGLIEDVYGTLELHSTQILHILLGNLAVGKATTAETATTAGTAQKITFSAGYADMQKCENWMVLNRDRGLYYAEAVHKENGHRLIFGLVRIDDDAPGYNRTYSHVSYTIGSVNYVLEINNSSGEIKILEYYGDDDAVEAKASYDLYLRKLS